MHRLADVPARWDTFEFIKLKSWSISNVAILGDAAHAQPPYLGQSGGCTMMNALGRADAATLNHGPISDALRT